MPGGGSRGTRSSRPKGIDCCPSVDGVAGAEIKGFIGASYVFHLHNLVTYVDVIRVSVTRPVLDQRAPAEEFTAAGARHLGVPMSGAATRHPRDEDGCG